MKSVSPSIIALLHGPDQPGLVARFSNWIWQRKGNILHADQHRDSTFEVFFQRIEWVPQAVKLEEEIQAFEAFAHELGMRANLRISSDRPRVALFVSKYDHCFHDLVLRWKAGEFCGDLACVISNHLDVESACRSYGLDFFHVPVSMERKEAVADRHLELLTEYRIDLGVLSRYMQVVPQSVIDALGGQIINVHHSFLPAFAGARPYHQAHRRGVKLIGATAHYATEDLDEGPIIAQEVAPVTHRHAVADLVRLGRDLERKVLSQAVRFHLEHRILCYQNKTVVFS